jgi:hypothetical protein
VALADARGAGQLADVLGAVVNVAWSAISYAAMLSWYASPYAGEDARRRHRSEYWQDGANSCTMIRALLDAGHSPDHTGEGGITALHLAVVGNDHELVVLLLARGADPGLKPPAGFDGTLTYEGRLDAAALARRTTNDAMGEVLAAAPAIRQHFLRSGEEARPRGSVASSLGTTYPHPPTSYQIH